MTDEEKRAKERELVDSVRETAHRRSELRELEEIRRRRRELAKLERRVLSLSHDLTGGELADEDAVRVACVRALAAVKDAPETPR